MKQAHSLKLVVLDADGTLLTSDKRVTPAVRAAVQTLAQHKLEICLASGRSIYALEVIASKLGVQTAMIGYGGAVVVAHERSAPLEQFTVDRGLLQPVVEIARTVDTAIYLYTHDLIIYEQHIEGMEWQLKDELRLQVVQDVLEIEKPVLKISIYGAPEELIAIRKAIKSSLGEVATVFPQPYLLDVTNLCANKGYALQALIRHLQIEPVEIAAIGDSENDLPVFELAGTSIAMSNAEAWIREQADWIAPSNDEDGVAWAIQRMMQDL